MPDIYSTEKRSQIMASIKSKNTRPEIIVFKYLNSEKIYFQKHYKRAIGSPDVALPRKKKALFIDGDFWHGRDTSKLLNKSEFWRNKIERNIERDFRQRNQLREEGWEILQVWESDLIRQATRHMELSRIKDYLN